MTQDTYAIIFYLRIEIWWIFREECGPNKTVVRRSAEHYQVSSESGLKYHRSLPYRLVRIPTVIVTLDVISYHEPGA